MGWDTRIVGPIPYSGEGVHAQDCYDPAKVAGSTRYYDYEEHQDKYQPFNPSGPGGRTTNVENNEKGILESGVQRVISAHRYSALGSDHDPYKQGIYMTNSVGDRD